MEYVKDQKESVLKGISLTYHTTRVNVRGTGADPTLSFVMLSKLLEICCRGLHGSRARNTSRKHAYSNKLKILPPKNGNFQMKNSDIFHISALNIAYGYSLEPPRRGGSNEYP